jgi:hypothetical protein
MRGGWHALPLSFCPLPYQLSGFPLIEAPYKLKKPATKCSFKELIVSSANTSFTVHFNRFSLHKMNVHI